MAPLALKLDKRHERERGSEKLLQVPVDHFPAGPCCSLCGLLIKVPSRWMRRYIKLLHALLVLLVCCMQAKLSLNFRDVGREENAAM